MKTQLSWKKRSFSSSCQILSGEDPIGELSYYTFKQTAEGVIRNKRYLFRTKGLFKQETQIIDGESDQVIGTITYASMKSRATIQFRDRSINWKYDSGWQTRWSLYDDRGILMKFASRNFSRGNIEFEEEDGLLVLTGMFVTNYFQQAMIVIMVAVFIPIWISILS